MSILEYLLKNNYRLIEKNKNSIRLVEHDSLVITLTNNKWY